MPKTSFLNATAHFQPPDPVRRGRTSPIVALVFWDGYLGVAPSLIAAIDALTARGYSVDVLMREAPSTIGFPPPPQFDATRTRIVTMPMLRLGGVDRSWAEASWRTRIGLLPRKLVKRAFEHLDRLRFRAFVRHAMAERRYDAIIAVDDDAVVAAEASTTRHAIPLIYWSLELDALSGGNDPMHNLTLAQARRARQRAALTIVQDTARAEALVRAGMPRDAIRLVPNAPAGAARTMEGRFFHDLFDLPPTQRVILHAGVMIAQTRVEEIAAISAAWPEDWTLVMHDREERRLDDPFTRHLEELGRGRVRISRRPVPYRDLDHLFASADVSLALYSGEFGENWALIALASGKLAHSLRVGVPVLCSALPGLKELVEDAGCGVAIQALEDSTAAIRHMLDDRDGFRERALACFHAHFDFDVNFRAVLKDLDMLVGNTT
jgi:glycosyltransferase involved in cell wall biosynthesis